MLLFISAKVAAIAQCDERELMLEFRPGTHIVFGRSTAPSAHCIWAVSSPLDKWQNSELHKTVAAALETYLDISASRVRITRVQLYEILDMNSQLEASSRPSNSNSSGGISSNSNNSSSGVISPRSPKEKTVTSPRTKEKKKEEKKKKGWSKSLEKLKASDLVSRCIL